MRRYRVYLWVEGVWLHACEVVYRKRLMMLMNQSMFGWARGTGNDRLGWFLLGGFRERTQ